MVNWPKPCCATASRVIANVRMIIACPACSTRYVVPDEAIGIDGRTVRCAKCKHNWHQDGPELAPREAVPEAPDTAEEQVEDNAATAAAEDKPETPEAADTENSTTEAVSEDAADEGSSPQPSVSYWRTADGQTEDDLAGDDGVDAEQGAATQGATVAPPIYQEPEPAQAAHPEVIDPYSGDGAEYSQFDYEPPFRARRNPLKMWTAAGVIFAVLAFATIIGVNYWGLPDWVPVERPIFAVEEPDLVLDFPGEQQDRRTLPNGTEYFGASGTITNIGRSSADVPAVLIILRDERNRIVYNWEVVPPQPILAPGETLTIKEAVTDVPRSAKFAEIGWKPN